MRSTLLPSTPLRPVGPVSIEPIAKARPRRRSVCRADHGSRTTELQQWSEPTLSVQGLHSSRVSGGAVASFRCLCAWCGALHGQFVARSAGVRECNAAGVESNMPESAVPSATASPATVAGRGQPSSGTACAPQTTLQLVSANEAMIILCVTLTSDCAEPLVRT